MGTNYKLTIEKLEDLKRRLKQLVEVDKKKLSDHLEHERSTNNDLSDTTYTELLVEMEELDMQIAYFKDMIVNHEIVKAQDLDEISLGSIASLLIDGVEKKYTLVTEIEADPLIGKISTKSPIGRALSGKRVGDEFEVDIANKSKKIKILEII